MGVNQPLPRPRANDLSLSLVLPAVRGDHSDDRENRVLCLWLCQRHRNVTRQQADFLDCACPLGLLCDMWVYELRLPRIVTGGLNQNPDGHSGGSIRMSSAWTSLTTSVGATFTVRFSNHVPWVLELTISQSGLWEVSRWVLTMQTEHMTHCTGWHGEHLAVTLAARCEVNEPVTALLPGQLTEWNFFPRRISSAMQRTCRLGFNPFKWKTGEELQRFSNGLRKDREDSPTLPRSFESHSFGLVWSAGSCVKPPESLESFPFVSRGSA